MTTDDHSRDTPHVTQPCDRFPIKKRERSLVLGFGFVDGVGLGIHPLPEFPRLELADAVVGRRELALVGLETGISRYGGLSVTPQDIYQFSWRNYTYIPVGVEGEKIVIPGNNVLSITLECTFQKLIIITVSNDLDRVFRNDNLGFETKNMWIPSLFCLGERQMIIFQYTLEFAKRLVGCQ